VEREGAAIWRRRGAAVREVTGRWGEEGITHLFDILLDLIGNK
jgi:hypothetical protein